MTDVVGVSSEAVAMDLIGRVFGLSDVHLVAVCGGGGHESLIEGAEGAVAMAARRKRMDRLFFAAANWERSGFAPPGSALTTRIVLKRLCSICCVRRWWTSRRYSLRVGVWR